MNEKQWMVSVPMDDLLALCGAVQEINQHNNNTAQLRRELDGLRGILNECMLALGDLRRQVKSCQPKG